MRTPCLYSIIRYAPFAETEEFANVGVILCVPSKQQFIFKLTQKNDSRVKAFFKDDRIFPQAKDAINKELNLVKLMSHSFNSAEEIAAFFANFTAKRESIFHFSTTRAVMAESPQAELENIFNKFINLSEYNKERREEILAKELKTRFRAYGDLNNTFKKQSFDGTLAKFSMPLVASSDYEVLCAIKPLAFNQSETSKMMEHCDKWVSRITRAADEKILNLSRVILPLEGPEKPTVRARKALETISETFRKNNINHISYDDEPSLIKFIRFSI